MGKLKYLKRYSLDVAGDSLKSECIALIQEMLSLKKYHKGYLSTGSVCINSAEMLVYFRDNQEIPYFNLDVKIKNQATGDSIAVWVSDYYHVDCRNLSIVLAFSNTNPVLNSCPIEFYTFAEEGYSRVLDYSEISKRWVDKWQSMVLRLMSANEFVI